MSHFSFRIVAASGEGGVFTGQGKTGLSAAWAIFFQLWNAFTGFHWFSYDVIMFYIFFLKDSGKTSNIKFQRCEKCRLSAEPAARHLEESRRGSIHAATDSGEARWLHAGTQNPTVWNSRALSWWRWVNPKIGEYKVTSSLAYCASYFTLGDSTT